jgi:predicted TIM-barrel fold metal-dependent hydrolase
MLEFIFDTTRAIVNLVLNGVVARCPNVEFLIPHAGAALPAIADRIAAFSLILPDADPAADVMRDLGRLHFDLAGFPLPRQLDALLAITTREQLHYGSDYPFTPEFVVDSLTTALDGAGLTDTLRANTHRLFEGLS